MRSRIGIEKRKHKRSLNNVNKRKHKVRIKLVKKKKHKKCSIKYVRERKYKLR